jgi:hypothetical protein
MNARLTSLLHRWVKPVLVASGAVAVAIGLSGCPLDETLSLALIQFLNQLAQGSRGLGTVVQHMDLVVTVSPDEASRGASLVVTVYSPSLPNSGDVFFTGEGITAVRRADPPVMGEAKYDVQIAADAPLRPFIVEVDQPATQTSNVLTVPSGVAWFYVRKDDTANAPRLSGITAPGAMRGSPVTLGLTGSNFDSSMLVVPEDPGIAVFNPNIASSTSATALAPLLPEDALTGQVMFAVETTAGRSTSLPLEIGSGRSAPVLSGLFPNYAALGANTEVSLPARGLAGGLRVLAPGGLLQGNAMLPFTHLATQQFRPSGLPRSEFISIFSVGGTSNAVEFKVLPARSEGPRIRDETLTDLTAGVTNQIRIVWKNLLNDTEPQLFIGGVSEVSQPIISTTVLRAQDDPASDTSIVIFEVAPLDHATSLYLAARTPDGLTTNTAFLRVAPQPATLPFVSRAQIGRVPRGGSVVDTFYGERLSRIFAVSFSADHMSAEIIGPPTDTSVQIRISATSEAKLTGDALTSLQLRAPNKPGNYLSYIVDPGTGTGNEPHINLLTPNWVGEGGGSILWISGDNFAATSTVAFIPANSVDPYPNQRRFIDSHNLEQPYVFPRSTGSLGVRVVTPGVGQSNRADLEVIDFDFRTGPLANFTGDEPVVGATRSQMTVFGEHLFESGATTAIGLRTEAHGDVIVSGKFYPNPNAGSSGGTHEGVVELETIEPPAPVPAQGAPAYFTLRRADGLTTHPLAIKVASSPATGPFVTRVLSSDGMDLQRNGTRTMRILGRGLTGVTSIAFAQEGVTFGAITPISDTELNVSFTAAIDAVITGEAITTLQVSNGLQTSNDASFIVLP